MKQITAHLLSFYIFCATAQTETTFKPNGPDDYRQGYHVFIHPKVVVSYNKTIDDGVLVIRDGKVVDVYPFSQYASKADEYKGAIIHDESGHWIYPSFIELYTDYGLKTKESKPSDLPKTEKGPYGWNQAIKPYIEAVNTFEVNEDAAMPLRKNGFGVALTHIADGIARGTGALVALTNSNENFVILNPRPATFLSFKKGSSKQEYPSSLMGSIALLRQTFLDAKWYESATSKREFNLSLEAWNKNLKLPVFFDAKGDWQDILRADKIGDEFGQQFFIKGNGDEYKRIEDLKSTNAGLVIPLNFPKPYDVSDPYKATWASIEEMRHWELAPTNLSRLAKENISFCITQSESKADFLSQLRLSVKHGLSEENALKALTHNPSSWLNADKEIGSLEKGKWANFFVSSKSIFDEQSLMFDHWIQGQQHFISKRNPVITNGVYALTFSDSIRYTATLSGDKKSLALQILNADSQKISAKIEVNEGLISISFSEGKDKIKNLQRLSGEIISANLWQGKLMNSNSSWIKWQAELLINTDTIIVAKPDTIDTTYVSTIEFPFLPYGNVTLPTQQTVLFKNATLWTNEQEGILTNTDLIIQKGRITIIGKNLSCANCEVIDATNKHLTTGIIDEHSHIAISRGVNEGTEASSAEVRIGDVVNSEDINIYRQLSGGVTSAQLLHGSANPIGGQSALIKMRWGQTPEKMKIEGADGFIKFALGENVKQSNWGERFATRYPQTRMGVEQTYINFFTKAKEYERNRKQDAKETRKDLELDALLEIINRKRFITCHSYVQSEINMLMHVADSFGFKVNTFTHILEGYKLADKMKAHGVHASTFADWWAYKYEVIDAIPQNAAILTKMGVNTAINSDDAEMGRRLNHEAAKSVKYGGLSEEEAWKLVTLNPAKMLHLDGRMGSLKVGKDADVVLWSGNPLSVYSRVEKTYVDGAKYYDEEADKQKQETIQKQRTALIQKMLSQKQSGGALQTPKPKPQGAYSCGESCHHEH
jgi:imidazolonepropionase-like amidohydrolase